MTRRRWLLAALALLVLGAVAVYLLKNLERYEETVDQGPSPEVRANPWLAAESFLRSRSIDVKTADSTNKLPDARLESQTLLLLDYRDNMTPSQADKVLQWARSGGHLLFVAEQLWDEKKGRSGDLLLDRLQIHQLLTKDLKGQDYSPISPVNPVIPLRAPAPKAPKVPWPELTRLYLENEEAPAYMSFDPSFHLEDPEDHAQSWANSADATHMLQLIYGEGLITVVTDADLWKNRFIDDYDNAWLLWYLTQDSKVTMVIRSQHDNLFSLLLRHFPQLVLMLTLLIGVGLWRAGMRQGPVRAPAVGARRQLTEHLRASAEFLRRRSGQQTLLRNLQAEILRRARIRHPGFESLVIADQWQVLARLTRQPTSVISQALRPRPAQRMSSSDFTRQVAHLQTIRNAL
ncbi:DUF4350 domain-containing protein [Pseudomonas syringae group sp. J309-1]|uniref:DUF4350 domain-containing protein n=1 Tax=Pseudomonas syringae group sp. J309-1 TaxID=3079588 RepID=UPI002912A4FD|nr:DUF4350 domain-containing protein [Pseudomonas syringae group sp. J309-1]MDU8359727.1 DUF4350 domain-containing protein [Pseudomonas syringae group sp. J309-1]